MRLEHIPDCQLARAPRTEVCPAERSEELRTHAVSEVGDAEPNSKVRPVIVQQIVAADAEMKGDADALLDEFATSSAFVQGNPDPPAAARLCTSLDDGNLPPE